MSINEHRDIATNNNRKFRLYHALRQKERALWNKFVASTQRTQTAREIGTVEDFYNAVHAEDLTRMAYIHARDVCTGFQYSAQHVATIRGHGRVRCNIG